MWLRRYGQDRTRLEWRFQSRAYQFRYALRLAEPGLSSPIRAAAVAARILAIPKGGPAFLLYDAKGKPRAAISMANNEPSIRLFDARGEPRAMLAIVKDEAGLDLLDARGEIRAELMTLKGQSDPVLNLNDAKGLAYGSFAVVKGEPRVFMTDAAGQPRGMFGIAKGDPLISLYDRKGTVTWTTDPALR